MPEVGAEIPHMFNLEGKLGTMPRLSGTDSFTQVFEAFVARAKQNPTYLDSLKTITEVAHSSKDDVASDIRYGRFDEKHPEVLSERLLGKWVGLAAEKALLDRKDPLSESEGARWIQLDGDVARLEDAILLLHRGKKGITLTQDAINVFADPKGDVQQKIVDSLDTVAAEMKRVGRRTAVKAGSVLVMGELILVSCTSHPEGSIITQVPTLNSNRPTTSEVMPPPFTETPTKTPELVATPTNIPIPDTMVDEVGAPTEVKKFAGSSESLRPMIDAFTQQLGFRPASGELAGFTVIGAKGEGSYFFVSHNGAAYTIFAHAEGGRFATVKVDGPDKTSDFAIFKMIRIDRDPSTVWWGIDAGQGDIAEPMFEFTLNSDGSLAGVSFVEPKSGKSIRLSESTTQIRFESKVLFALREPEIGGGKSVVLWMDINMKTYKLDSTVPPEFAPYLVPTAPEQWASLDTLTMSNGKPIPWGGAITYLELGDPYGKSPVIPGLVRGVVEYGAKNGLPAYGAIIEFPVKGGSVFYIAILLALQKNPYLPTSQLIPGAYPVECTGGVVCKGEQTDGATTNSDSLNAQEMVSLLQKLTGKMALFSMRPTPEHRAFIDAIAHGSLATGETPVPLDMPEIWYQP